MTSIKNKNKIYNKFCQAKDQTRKQYLHEKFKIYRNEANSIVPKVSNIVSKGIKEIILINKSNEMQSFCLKIGDKIIKKNLRKKSITSLEQWLKKFIKKHQTPINSTQAI